MRIGYARVSTDDQTLDLQRDALKRAKCREIYEEHASGKNTARPTGRLDPESRQWTAKFAAGSSPDDLDGFF